MHHIPSVEPIPLQESISDYSFSGLSDFLLGNNNKRSNKSMERYPEGYGVYYGPMPPMERIVPHENDILMGRGGKNNQHTGNEKLRQVSQNGISKVSLLFDQGIFLIPFDSLLELKQRNTVVRQRKENRSLQRALLPRCGR